MASASSEKASGVTLGSIFRTFFMAGAISFGGGVVAYLHEYVVRRQNWLDDSDFLGALAIGQSLPGLNALNVSVLVGDRLRGIPGAATAVVAMLTPGAVVILAIGSALQGRYQVPDVKLFLAGVAATAVGLLTAVMLRLGRATFRNATDCTLVLATFAGVSLLHLPVYGVLLVVTPAAIWLHRPRGTDTPP